MAPTFRGAEFDEYELQRHLEAREDGFKTGLVLSIAFYLISGVVAAASQFWAHHPLKVEWNTVIKSGYGRLSSPRPHIPFTC